MEDTRKKWDDLVARLHAEGRIASHLGLSGNGTHYYCPRCQPDNRGRPELELKIAHFRCYRCDTEGDLIGLIRFARNCDFDAALNWISEETGCSPDSC